MELQLKPVITTPQPLTPVWPVGDSQRSGSRGHISIAPTSMSQAHSGVLPLIPGGQPFGPVSPVLLNPSTVASRPPVNPIAGVPIPNFQNRIAPGSQVMPDPRVQQSMQPVFGIQQQRTGSLQRVPSSNRPSPVPPTSQGQTGTAKLRTASPQPPIFANICSQGGPGQPQQGQSVGLVRNRSACKPLGGQFQQANGLNNHRSVQAPRPPIPQQTFGGGAQLHETVFRKYACQHQLAANAALAAVCEVSAAQGLLVPSQQHCCAVLAAADSNRDGFLTFAEFLAACSKLAL